MPSFPRDPSPYFDNDTATANLQRYFSLRADGGPAFTGSRFNSWGADNDPDLITADDVIAVQLLSMRPHWTTTWELLDGRKERIEDLLRRVRADVDVWDAAAESAHDEAQPLWGAIFEIPGAGRALTSKLLARKRPRLIPVWDSVVRAAVGAPKEPWACFRDWFGSEANREKLERILRDADVPVDVPLLRVFDIVIWMAATGRTADAGPDDD